MLRVENISFAYKEDLTLNSIGFNAKLGDHIAVVGESGSGKTTLLNLIYGKTDLYQGSIFWKDQKILGPKYNLLPDKDYMHYVTQEFDLMPYTSVYENIGKNLSNFDLNKKDERILELLEIVELIPFKDIKVLQLSGGQKQRVALAKAIAKTPEILLLDEPFSHIDNFKKNALRRNLFNYLKSKNITCIIATHDREDVISFSDNMLVLHQGKMLAFDTPKNLYENPKHERIASFFGEFNNLKSEGIFYAHQLKVVDHSSLKVEVKKSYYKGNYYLIESTAKGQTIFFYHSSEIPSKNKVYLLLFKH